MVLILSFVGFFRQPFSDIAIHKLQPCFVFVIRCKPHEAPFILARRVVHYVRVLELCRIIVLHIMMAPLSLDNQTRLACAHAC